MCPPAERRCRIGEASRKTGVPTYLLRQWEEKVTQLKPRRDHADRRYYVESDLEIIRRIKYLLHHEGLTFEGVNLRLGEERAGAGRPRTNSDVVDVLDRIQDEIRAMLDLIDENTARDPAE